MSAYIVQDQTLHRIITYLNTHRDIEWAFRHHLGPLGYDRSQAADLDRRAGEMHLMNCAAVDDRYGRGTAANDTSDTMTLPVWKIVVCTPLQAYKSLTCFLYQCSEGEVPEQPLFKALQAIKHSIADDIINALPAYDLAIWA